MKTLEAIEVDAPSNGFDYSLHNDAFLTRLIQIRLTEEMEYVKDDIAPDLRLPRLKMLDRFISLSINRATKEELPQVMKDISQLKYGLNIIRGI